MKTFRKILIWVLAVIIILLVVAFLLPSEYHLERSVYIKANKMTIYDLTARMNKWSLWEPWNKQMDSTVVYELVGTDGTVGSKRIWNGQKLKDGEMTITQLVPGELVAYDISFQKGKFKSSGKMTIQQAGDSCKVSWIDDGNLGSNPMHRYMGLFMGKMMNPQFDQGLAKLKTIAEERNSWPKIEETTIPAQDVLVIRDSAGMSQFESVMGRAYGELAKYIRSSGLNISGHPFSITLKWDSVNKSSVMKIGMPVDKEGKGKGRIVAEKIPQQNAVVAYYFGPYEKMEPAYNALEQYCKEAGKEITGGPWEIYFNSPMNEKDPAKLETHILFPVR